MMSQMDKIIEDFLMPPPDSSKSLVLRNSTDSLRDGSSSSLDRSNNSSSTSISWNSSCSCHSMASKNNSGNKSTFVFHKQPILPPLLCSSSRTEMKVYKMKAVEKEQKRREKEKQRLISRVEAILSSVEVSPVKPSFHKPTEQPIEEADMQTRHSDIASRSHGSTGDSDCDITDSHNDEGTGTNDNIDSDSSHSDATSRHNDHDDVTNSKTDDAKEPPKKAAGDGSSSDGSSDDDSSFHDNAYRSSLRNLLQKSLSMSLNQSGAVDRKTSKEDSQPSKSSSESDEDGNTGNTVIDVRPASPQNDAEEPNSDSTEPKLEESDLYSEEETLVQSIVESVLDGAKKEISGQNNPPLLDHNELFKVVDRDQHPDPENQTFFPENKNAVDFSSWETPKVQKGKEGEVPENLGRRNGEEPEISPFSITSSQFFELHNQSTSTKVDIPLQVPKEANWEEKALEKFANLQKFDPPKCDPSPRGLSGGEKPFQSSTDAPGDIEQGINPEDSPVYSPKRATSIVELSGTLCFEDTVSMAHPLNEVSRDPTIDDLTVLKPVMSDTVSDVASMTLLETDQHKVLLEDNMKENCDPSMEQGPLFSLKRSLSFTLEQPSSTFESAVIEAVSHHFHKLQDDEPVNGRVSPNPGNDRAAVKEKKIRQARVRRGSYTLDEPSPYLVKNKDSLTIDSGALDDDVCSEITCETGPQDVKRKLDLVSDSEESSIPASVKKIGLKENGQPSKAELNVANLCKILQDQHVQQMEMMKQRHEQQLQSLQQELILGDKKTSLDGVGNVAVQPPLSHDVTVSPSLASTEYKDICIRPPPSGVPTHYHVNNENHQELASCQESDVSRVTDVEMSPSLHEKFCKLSALCKGHLTRRMLGSNKVQEILQTIRDTSRLILSLHSEVNESQGMDSITDMYLEDRLYNQLRSAMHQLHHIFFDITIGEKMYIIAQSSVLEKMAEKLPKTHKPQKLSAATQKSLERKRLLSSSSPTQSATHGKVTHKEVKSKISHIWKTDPPKPVEKTSPPVKLLSTNHARRPASKPHMTSQIKSKSPVTSQPRPVTSTTKSMTSSQRSGKKSPTKYTTSQSHGLTSQRTDLTTQSRKPASKLKSDSSKPAFVRSKPASSQKSQTSITSDAKVKSVTSQLSTKQPVQGSKVMQRKTGRRKPTPLADVNKTALLSK